MPFINCLKLQMSIGYRLGALILGCDGIENLKHRNSIHLQNLRHPIKISIMAFTESTFQAYVANKLYFLLVKV